ncbi:hypothetical protein EDD21DRAFT_416572 [Dissophora ornata]|nr:hypothetical protein BGZ58_009004 [Dissophora ornata]KAI8599664.1 hypothetical protein EDD21DRAFT_416572 [Dissophora ornata]
MVHPGIVVASVFGVVVTGVVLYTILREEFQDFFESFEKPSPAGYGYEQPRDQQQQQQRGQRGSGQDDDNYDFDQGRGQSSTMYQADYELRQRRSSRKLNEDENENENEEKEPDHDLLMERLRKINETEHAIAANEARLAEMERAMQQREENLQRREQELASIRHQQQLQMPQSSEIYQNPFATNEPLISNYSNNDDAQPGRNTSALEVNPRTADAILRHNLSGNHQENVNPFEDPASLFDNASSSSARSSVRGDDDVDAFADAEDRSVTVGHDDEDLDWTEAEIGSVGSHESDESWGSH